MSPAALPPEGSGLVTRASAVRSRSIRWAWTGRLAIGYMVVQTGVEGLGKSVFAAWMLAQLSRGELEGDYLGQPVNALVVAGEDGIEDTWRPRVDLAGADPDRVGFLNFDQLGGDWNLRDGISQLEAAVDEMGARILFVDAALDHMPPPKGGESITSATFVRQAFAPLRSMTRERGLVTDFSMHPPKARSGDFRDLVQASQAFSAMPRVGLLFAYHPEDAADDPQRRRVLLRGKGNLGRDPGAIEFRVVGRPYKHDDGVLAEREVVADVGPSSVTLADLWPGRMLGERQPSKADRAEEIITEELADGAWHEAAPVRARLHSEKLDHNAVVTDAKRRVGVESRQRPGVAHGGWEWRARGDSDNETDSETDSETLTPPRARVLPDEMTLTQKTDENPVSTVRVSESTNGNVRHAGGGHSQSATEIARAREGTAPGGPTMTEFGICPGCGRRMMRTADAPICVRRDCPESALRERTVAHLSDAELLATFPGSTIERISPANESGEA